MGELNLFLSEGSQAVSRQESIRGPGQLAADLYRLASRNEVAGDPLPLCNLYCCV